MAQQRDSAQAPAPATTEANASGEQAQNPALAAAGAMQIKAALESPHDAHEGTLRGLNGVRRSISSITLDDIKLVGGESAHAISENLPEIIAVSLAFVVAEGASVALASTGVGSVGAMFIQYALAAWGGEMAIAGAIEGGKHAENWLRLAWHAGDDEEQLRLASVEFIRMSETLALAILAAVGAKANVVRGTRAATTGAAGVVDAMEGDTLGQGAASPAQLRPESGAGKTPADWVRLGAGSQSQVRARGNDVVGRLRRNQFEGNRVPLEARRQQVQLLAQASGIAHDCLGNVVPRKTVAREGSAIWRQEKADGLSIEQIEQLGQKPVADIAWAEMKALTRKLTAAFPASECPSPEFSWAVDPNPSNFRFSSDGHVTAWFDPVAVEFKEKLTGRSKPRFKTSDPQSLGSGAAASLGRSVGGAAAETDRELDDDYSHDDTE